MQNIEVLMENPEVFQVNRLDVHSDHHVYLTEEEWQNKRESLRQSLNGTWKFKWSRNLAERPEKFMEEGYSMEEFSEIQVPGHMELQGYDHIQYINTMYPWDGHIFLRPPHVDKEYNPVGSYVKEFDLEDGLKGKRICISFQGVEQAFSVWLNGTFIGYGEDTFTPSEFDLSEVIREKQNRLCVEVYKRCSAAWIEDQDFFRFSGIFREVYLYARPETHVEDLWIKAGLEDDYNTGKLQIEAKLSGSVPKKVCWKMEDAKGLCVAEGILSQDTATENQTWKSESMRVKNVHIWDVGAPYLYQIKLEVLNARGEVTEFIPYKAGFRRFEIRNKIMLLNGKRLCIHGVNRHEWNPHRGRAITEADMRRDVEILKRNHINAVRTSHYPNQSLWYQLCDEAGICVMDETNLESHGSWQKMGTIEPSWNVPGSEKEWEACVVDRAQSMLERDKNHPSILWWSCGNESYAGTCILAMSRYFKQKDPSRLVHYEGVYWNRAFEQISDVESRMYAPPREIEEYLKNDPQKPFLLCEYMHDMGNSIGGMESYIKLFDHYPMYQGGFIWDYIDQALWMKNAKGQEVLGYGGDFGERPSDYAFSGNGIVFADRTEKPAMQEVRYWYSTAEERAQQDLVNTQNMQAAINKLTAEREQETGQDGLKVTHGDVMLGVKGSEFEILFSYQDGGPVSMVYEGKECLYRAPKPAFWRAATENDKGCGFPVQSAIWMGAESYSTCVDCQVEELVQGDWKKLEPREFAGRKAADPQIKKVKVTYTYMVPVVPQTTVDIQYIVDSTGKMQVSLHYYGKKGLPELPVFGLRFFMPEAVETVRWQGLSGETYPDRYKGGVFGIHEEKVSVPDYLVPQECGNHMNTCQMEIGNLKIVMDQEPFLFAVLPNTPLELETAMHKYELPDTGRTVVSVLGKMRGVGGINSWGADVEEAYHVSAEEDIEFSFYMMPVTGE